MKKIIILCLTLIKKIGNTITKLPLEDKLKKESRKLTNFQINPLEKYYINKQLDKKRELHKNNKENNILMFKKLINKELKENNIKFEYKNKDTTILIFNLVKKDKYTLREKELFSWYLSNSQDVIKNRKMSKDLNRYLGITDKTLFSGVYKKNVYSRNDAADYANKHYNDYNKEYPNYGDSIYEGGDCANFISQCLHAGGMQWVIKSSYYNRAENWWCKPGATDKDGDIRITLSWKTTYGFKNHWKSRAAKYSSNTAVSMKKNWNKWLNELERGDVIQLADKDGDPWHTMIICDYAYKDFKLAAHTSDTNSALFKGYILEHRVVGNDKVLIYQIN